MRSLLARLSYLVASAPQTVACSHSFWEHSLKHGDVLVGLDDEHRPPAERPRVDFKAPCDQFRRGIGRMRIEIRPERHCICKEPRNSASNFDVVLRQQNRFAMRSGMQYRGFDLLFPSPTVHVRFATIQRLKPENRLRKPKIQDFNLAALAL
jgi:hypothetical protein